MINPVIIQSTFEMKLILPEYNKMSGNQKLKWKNYLCKNEDFYSNENKVYWSEKKIFCFLLAISEL